MYKHILLPTDGSALAREAIQAGVKLAKALGARVTGFYAAPPATPLEYKGFLPVGYRRPGEARARDRKGGRPAPRGRSKRRRARRACAARWST